MTKSERDKALKQQAKTQIYLALSACLTARACFNDHTEDARIAACIDALGGMAGNW